MKKILTVIIPLLLIVVMFSVATPSSRAAQPESQPVVQKDEVITVYIDKIHLNAGNGEITVDPILWYEGKEAEQAFAQYEPDAGIDGPPDGYYIVNDDEKLQKYPLANDAEVLMQIYDHTGNVEDIDISWNEHISLQKFAQLFEHTELLDVRDFPYHLTIENGQVTRIVQQYIP
ncbi:hypothetical protein D3C74_185760 [compost metagenome]